MKNNNFTLGKFFFLILDHSHLQLDIDMAPNWLAHSEWQGAFIYIYIYITSFIDQDSQVSACPAP